MTASTHWLATATAQSVLERGGNAIDAAVAGCFVLHLVEPHLNGPGGDLVALVSVDGRTVQSLSGQGPAPSAANLVELRDQGMEAVPGAGALAAAVPGAVPALLMLLREHGSWEFGDVISYAIDLAAGGVPVAPQLSDVIGTVAPLFREHWPASARQWLPGDRVPRPGQTLINAPWARTLESLAVTASAAGPTREDRIGGVEREWREGFVAIELAASARTVHRHADGVDRAGLLSTTDIRTYSPVFEPAEAFEFRGTTIMKAGPWSSGPVLLQALSILACFSDDDLDPSTAVGAHLIVEAWKLAFADRDAYYGESGRPAPLVQLLHPDHARARAALITDRADSGWRPSRIPGFDPYLPPLSTAADAVSAGIGEPTVRLSGETRGDTCHLDVVDRHGMTVSITPSGGWLQSSPFIESLGFSLGTRLQMSWLDPASPAALRAGKRPRTTLSPTMLVRNGHVVEALGTPGGDQQDQWQLPYLLRRLIGGYEMQQAIDAPAFHTTHLPGSFWPRTWAPRGVIMEDGFAPAVIDELRQRGHDVTLVGPWTLGRLSAVARDPATRNLSAAANPRGSLGYAAGR